MELVPLISLAVSTNSNTSLCGSFKVGGGRGYFEKREKILKNLVKTKRIKQRRVRLRRSCRPLPLVKKFRFFLEEAGEKSFVLLRMTHQKWLLLKISPALKLLDQSMEQNMNMSVIQTVLLSAPLPMKNSISEKTKKN